MPDFANPTGAHMDLSTRLRLLDIAEQEDIVQLEDNPYGLFHGSSPHLPTLKALDRAARVIYLGSFAKTVIPGARIGYVVADQPVSAPGRAGLLADEMSKIKSMVTVNTPAVAQAVVAGVPGLGGERLVAVPVAQRGAGVGVLVPLGADPGRGLGLDQLLQHPLGYRAHQFQAVC
ncbi:DNA-binding transcriptional MocR family regulator [Streptacidiphilus sp. EB103A]